MQCVLKNSDVGAVLDTGTQRSAAIYHELLGGPLQGKAHQDLDGLLHRDYPHVHGTPLTLVIPDESVCDPLLSDSLVSAGRLVKAGFGVIFRLPKDTVTVSSLSRPRPEPTPSSE